MRTRRSIEERIAALDAKIVYHHELIIKLTEKKNKITEPVKYKVRKTSMQKAISAIKESGLTPDEILAMVEKKRKKAVADLLGYTITEQTE